jgi:transcriptional regulator GlxA family with amidase domain
VLYLRQVGGQSQLGASLAPQANAADKLRGIVAWIEEHPDGDLSIPALAGRAAMSERTFARVFLAETGMTPARLVELVRLDRAKQLLATTRWPLARVANRSGLGSAATLARTFRRDLASLLKTIEIDFELASSEVSGSAIGQRIANATIRTREKSSAPQRFRQVL